MDSLREDDVVILSGVRTPVGCLGGSLKNCRPQDLGSVVIREALHRAGLQGKESNVSEVIMGHVLTAGHGMNPARQASVMAQIPNTTPAHSVSMVCGSGLKAVMLACQAIRSGDARVVVAGGMESMSQARHCMDARNGVKFGDVTLVDTMMYDGLTDAFLNYKMGVTAENVAHKYNISREDQDQYALLSQQRAEAAAKAGFFVPEIVGVQVPAERGSVAMVTLDEQPRFGSTLQGLAKLKPVFQVPGTVTSGNASTLNDGAAAVVLTSWRWAKEAGLPVLARVVAQAQTGCDPTMMGIGPVSAIRMVVHKSNWTLQDVDLFEVNEAFASTSLAVIQELGLDQAKVNPRGGAIALGHPIGASGARCLVTLLHALQSSQGKKGVVSLCIGGGMGVALSVELIS